MERERDERKYTRRPQYRKSLKAVACYFVYYQWQNTKGNAKIFNKCIFSFEAKSLYDFLIKLRVSLSY